MAWAGVPGCGGLAVMGIRIWAGCLGRVSVSGVWDSGSRSEMGRGVWVAWAATPGCAGLAVTRVGVGAGSLGRISVSVAWDSGSWSKTGRRVRVAWTGVRWRGGARGDKSGARGGLSRASFSFRYVGFWIVG